MTLINFCLSLPRTVKRIFAVLVDCLILIFTVWFAFYLRLGEWINPFDTSWRLFTALSVAIYISIPIFIISGLYRNIFRYSGLSVLITLVKSVGIYALIYLMLFTIIGVDGVPRTVGLIQPLLLLLIVSSSRIFVAFWLGSAYRRRLVRLPRLRVLIYGAGSSGRQLAGALSGTNQMQVVGFLDDDEHLIGNTLNGSPIFRALDLQKLVAKLEIDEILLALPNVSRKQRNQIIAFVSSCRVHVRTLPSLVDLARGKVQVSDIHELDVEDLLGRDTVAPNINLLRKNIANKTVLVTGAGGSIGSELCRQILQQSPKKLILLEQSEFNLYQLHQELSQVLAQYPDLNIELISILASVRDQHRLEQVFAMHQPQTVYHAAAYKHVPLVEDNPIEAIENNVFGTLVAAQVAIEFQVENFILISTDKAVRPTNVMGATKRLAEMILQALGQQSKTIFSMTRFGNVLGSSGSVVPKFKGQIQQGGPVTITHQDVTRYFMTIPEAAQLVLQASAMAKGGDVFLLDMGEPVKILDLAQRMIELSGLTICDEANPDGDIEIEVVGLRPGEKLYEELLISDNPEKTENPKIMKAHENYLPWSELNQKLSELRDFCEENYLAGVEASLVNLVSGYTPDKKRDI